MAARMLSIPDEIWERLKKESNMSFLVSNLIKKHFESLEAPAFTIEQLKEQRETALKRIDGFKLLGQLDDVRDAQEAMNIIDKKIIMLIEEDKKKQYDENNKDRIAKIKSFQWNNEITAEYKKGIADGKWRSSTEFVEKKLGIKK